MNKYFLPVYHSKLKPWIKWWLLREKEDSNLFPYSDNYHIRRIGYSEVTINKPIITFTNKSSSGSNLVWWSIPITKGKTYIIKYDLLDYNYGYWNNVVYNFTENEVTKFNSLGTTQKIDTELKSIEVEATGNYVNIGISANQSASSSNVTVTVENLQLLEK